MAGAGGSVFIAPCMDKHTINLYKHRVDTFLDIEIMVQMIIYSILIYFISHALIQRHCTMAQQTSSQLTAGFLFAPAASS